MSAKLLLSLILSITIMIIAILLSIFAKNRAKTKTYVSPLLILTIGVFLALCIIFYPIYKYDYFLGSTSFLDAYKSICLSIRNAMSFFVVDGDFNLIKDFLIAHEFNKVLESTYYIYSSTLYVFAPITVLGVVLSFFGNIITMISYFFCFRKDFYYMSELNEQSLMLSKDIIKNNKKRAKIVFCDVDKEIISKEQLLEAQSLNALIFSQKINELPIKKPTINRFIKIYFISEDEESNLDKAIKIVNHYYKNKNYDNKNFQCYVFARTEDSTIILDNLKRGNIKVRKVNRSRNFIISILQNNSIFDNAIKKDGYKEVNILIVGLGRYGKELLKAICWCGQMIGYKLTINVVDKQKDLEDIMYSEAPGLISCNNKNANGDAQYKINFHDETDVLSKKFAEKIDMFSNTTSVFVMLGDDQLNLKSAFRLRELFGRLKNEGNGNLPKIYASVFSSDKHNIFNDMDGLKNFKCQKYDIKLIGSNSDQYSQEVIEQTRLEEKALKVHMGYSKPTNKEEETKFTELFNSYEYNRKSSMSEVVYSEFRTSLGITLLDDQSNAEILKDYEHRRWCAYMRSEGYVYGKIRDDIAKTHPSLKDYNELDKKEKQKDLDVLLVSEKK